MNIANVFIQIFRQITVGVVSIFVRLLHGIFELEATIVGGACHCVIHAVQLVTVEREGQVVYQAIGRSPRLPVALQSEYVPVLVVACHFLGESVGVAA